MKDLVLAVALFLWPLAFLAQAFIWYRLFQALHRVYDPKTPVRLFGAPPQAPGTFDVYDPEQDLRQAIDNEIREQKAGRL